MSYGPRREPEDSDMSDWRSFSYRRFPVQDDRNRRVDTLCDRRNQKPLTIRRNHILMTKIGLLRRAAEGMRGSGDFGPHAA